MNFSLQNSPQIFQGIIMYIIILRFLVVIKTTESDSLSGKRKLIVHFMLSFFI